MIRLFILAWATYFAILLILPVEILYGGSREALIVQLSFIVLVIVSYRAVADLGRLPAQNRAVDTIAHTRMLVAVALAASIAGLAALVVDKLVIQGIDYTAGLAAAREQWRLEGLRRSGFSSPFSVVGYLLGNAYFVAIMLAVAQFHCFSRRERFVIYLSAAALGLLNSILTGGRSSLLLLAAFTVAALVVRDRVRLVDLFPRRWDRVSVALIGLVGLGYALYVTAERASTYDMTTALYVMDSSFVLGLPLKEWYIRTFDGSVLSDYLAALVFAGTYLTHSFATVAAMIDAPADSKIIILSHVMQLLSRLGLVAPPDIEWFLSGRFPSLPGALWFQFGSIGLVAGSVLVGAVSGLSTLWTARHPHSLLPAGFQACCCVILLLSPLIFAGDLLAFPFIAVSFILLAGIQAIAVWYAGRRPRTALAADA